MEVLTEWGKPFRQLLGDGAPCLAGTLWWCTCLESPKLLSSIRNLSHRFLYIKKSHKFTELDLGKSFTSNWTQYFLVVPWVPTLGEQR